MLTVEGCGVEGGVWGIGCRCLPIRDRAHQVNVTKYIRKHVQQGAAVWSVIRGEIEDNPAAGAAGL